jgi:hypothetical protein
VDNICLQETKMKIISRVVVLVYGDIIVWTGVIWDR